MATVAAVALYAGVCVDAFVIEPNWPALRCVEIVGNVSEPVEILHLSDLHIEEDLPRREVWLLEQLARLEPDLILLTGDTHQAENSDPVSLARILGEIQAPLGVYACIGYDNATVVEGVAPQVKHLVNEAVLLEHRGRRIGVAGLMEVGERAPVYDAVQAADYAIVLNHTPDLADEAVAWGVDLYLCGHTHGGQVRIPFWGAIITNCDSGKKYEGGWYRNGATHIHTSRGLGLEPRPAPQVRFFCRPEITLIRVIPEE